MSLLDYGEERFIEPLAIETFEDLGWTHLDAMAEKDGSTHITGRGSRRDVVLVERLRAAAEALNPHIPAAGIEQAIEAFTADRSTMSVVRANQAVYTMLKRGVTVRVEIDGIETDERVRLINWDDPYANDFLVVNQLWVVGTHHTRRPDVVGFVNGIPLVFVELKADTVPVKDAYDKNLRDYRDTIPQMFWYNAFLMLSNGSEALVGSTTAGWEHFGQWKKISDEEEAATVDMQTAIIGTCEPARLLDLIANFTVFQDGTTKIVAKNHQYLGVNNVMQALGTLGEGDQRLGVFWHTQGAGKSFSMLFFAQKVLRTLPGNWTFVIVTDRTNLDAQIYKNFARSGAVTEPEEEVRAQDSEHLRQLLREDHRYVFTLIQKFRTESPGEAYPVLSERNDIIVITDEAHRSQYDVFAQNMRDALPNARFLGFTGTPLMGSDEMTRQVFGDYVSIYNFAQSIADGATVPLWYENRIPQLQLINEDFNEDMEDLLEDVQLDEAQEKRLEREFQREYHLITRLDRIDTIAADIVEHFINRGHLGKAMVVSIDKMTTVRMYDLVHHHWDAKLADLRTQLAESMPEIERIALEDRIAYMEQTDMAVVVSQSQGEVADFREKGLDILPHRQRMNDEDLAEKFKDPDDPFRIVFVCAMWMTGFDAKACSTIYLDKPMRNHTLMQTGAFNGWGECQNRCESGH